MKSLKAHELLEEGYALIGEMAHRQQLRQRLEEEDKTNRLNRMVQTMSTTYDIETLDETAGARIAWSGHRELLPFPL